jgi:cobalt-zinc-cadmium efflux system outer membrane protein
VERIVAAGAGAPTEAAAARVSSGRAAIARAKAERELAGARALLAATWGSSAPRFRAVGGDLNRFHRLPSEAELAGALVDSPALARWESEQAARRSALALEQAQRIPDVTVGAGGRHFSDNGDNALVFEVSLPLPLFDRNRAGVEAARERLGQAGDEAAAATLGARAALAEAYQHLLAASEEATTLDARVLPEARRAVQGTLHAFRQGQGRAVAVIEAQRVLRELEGEYVDALERYHFAAVDIERLTGVPLAAAQDRGAR